MSEDENIRTKNIKLYPSTADHELIDPSSYNQGIASSPSTEPQIFKSRV